jgi:replicative DNA helicase
MIAFSSTVEKINLPAEAFYEPKHQRAYLAIHDLRQRDLLIDEKTVAAELRRYGSHNKMQACW